MKTNLNARRSSFIAHHSAFSRRGVLLLLVLALLSMFGLIAVAFVVISGHASECAEHRAAGPDRRPGRQCPHVPRAGGDASSSRQQQPRLRHGGA